MTKSIELTGEVSTDLPRAEAISSFADLFNCSVDDVERLLANAPLVIKSQLSDDKAEKLKDLIDATGIECLTLNDQLDMMDNVEAAQEEQDDTSSEFTDESSFEDTLTRPSFTARIKSWFGR